MCILYDIISRQRVYKTENFQEIKYILQQIIHEVITFSLCICLFIVRSHIYTLYLRPVSSVVALEESLHHRGSIKVLILALVPGP